MRAVPTSSTLLVTPLNICTYSITTITTRPYYPCCFGLSRYTHGGCNEHWLPLRGRNGHLLRHSLRHLRDVHLRHDHVLPVPRHLSPLPTQAVRRSRSEGIVRLPAHHGAKDERPQIGRLAVTPSVPAAPLGRGLKL